MPTDRERTRAAIVAATADLLRSGGSDAVTTRAVASAAGVQAPVIYRLFGDKEGLVRAVATHSYAAFVATKESEHPSDDPLDDLRRGWDLAVEFWLEHPALHTMLRGGEGADADAAVHEAGLRVLRERVDRLAAAGRLRITADLAVAVIRATADGAVVTTLATPADRRDPALLRAMREAMREAMVAAVAVETSSPTDHGPDDGPAGAARALRARLSGRTVLSEAEHLLLDEWLTRLEHADEE